MYINKFFPVKNLFRFGILMFFLINACKKDSDIYHLPPTLATVTTDTVMNITKTTAEIHGKIVSNGGQRITGNSRIKVSGVCWSTSPEPTTDDSKTTDGPLIGEVTANLSDLESGTLYYARVYAVNAAGIAYGTQLAFRTDSTDKEEPGEPSEPIGGDGFADDFDRSDAGPATEGTNPNPIGDYWDLIQGQFSIEDNRLVSHAAGEESYMLFKKPGLDMKVGDGNSFTFTCDLDISEGGSFGGIIFNAQSDDNQFYLLRFTAEKVVQFLKAGSNGLNDWAGIIINDDGGVPELPDDGEYSVEVSSSEPGKFTIKIKDPFTQNVVKEYNAEDNDNPYVGGVAGVYTYGLANPTDLYFDNFEIELSGQGGSGGNNSGPISFDENDWHTVLGSFIFQDDKVIQDDGGDIYTVYEGANSQLPSTSDESFVFKVDIDVPKGGNLFGGVAFNSQDNGGLYILRTKQITDANDGTVGGTIVQILKFDDEQLTQLNFDLFVSEEASDHYVENYRIKIESSEPGTFKISLIDPATGDAFYENTVSDNGEPFKGGKVGLYVGDYSGDADPVTWENFSLEIN